MVQDNLDREHFETMSIDELWALHTDVDEVLAARLISLKRKLEKRLERLTGRRNPTN